ncbi:MAG: SDR family NAD(P)-dependent oxidoreductase [Pseudomonadota bacterium]
MPLTSFSSPINAAVFGASGGLGSAFVKALEADENVGRIFAFSRSSVAAGPKTTHLTYQDNDEDSLFAAVDRMKSALDQAPLHLGLVTIGTLHTEDYGPEKALRHFEMNNFLEVMRINAGLPTLIGKALLPLLKVKERSIFAALSARVGSISDNRLGGWHSYRASKAALNQLMRNISIELKTRNPHGVAVTLHPGTVDTNLSEPFQGNVPEGKLFTADYSAEKLLAVIDELSPEDSSKCFDYKGEEITP